MIDLYDDTVRDLTIFFDTSRDFVVKGEGIKRLAAYLANSGYTKPLVVHKIKMTKLPPNYDIRPSFGRVGKSRRRNERGDL